MQWSLIMYPLALLLELFYVYIKHGLLFVALLLPRSHSTQHILRCPINYLSDDVNSGWESTKGAISLDLHC